MCVFVVWVVIFFGMYECCEVVGSATRAFASEFAVWLVRSWLFIGFMYIVVGVVYFVVYDGFMFMMLYKGVWGFWNLSGSASFYVNWTGVAEILGGFGVVFGLFLFGFMFDFCEFWLMFVSVVGLFLLIIVVMFVNMYMWIYNSFGSLSSNVDEFM